MNEQWIQEYLEEHPEQCFWNYLQNNPEQSKILLGTDYDELNWIVEKAKSLHQLKQDGQDESQLSLEEQILLALIRLTQDLEVHSLSLLFAISESTVENICFYWQLIFQENHLLWYKLNLAKSHKRNTNFQVGSQLDSHLSPINTGFLFGRNVCIAGGLSATNLSPRPSLYSTSLPLNKRTEPLPHDGLFIRRNNQFGTRMSIGIKDLIEQGVMVEQTNIRFDDFVALNSERVPSPQADNSLAVSYGIAPISLSQKRDERATHYLEIALKTSTISPTGHPTSHKSSTSHQLYFCS
jgi:hypothetical protein